jgi:predicted small metal-binding protein
MKQFSCGDVVPGCAATFTGSTDDQILGAVATHAQQDHGMVEIPDALVEQVRGQIVSV